MAVKEIQKEKLKKNMSVVQKNMTDIQRGRERRRRSVTERV